MSSLSPYGWLHRRLFSLGTEPVAAAPARTRAHADPAAVQRLIDAHRHEGHRWATLDPLQATRAIDADELAPRHFGLSPDDALPPDGPGLPGAHDVLELARQLKAVYCGPLALDCSAVRDTQRSAWLFSRMEATSTSVASGGTALLDRLIQVQAWEHHTARRFPHAKRFSLEGCEALVPLLDSLVEQAAAHGLEEVFMGMPHRGRVNVLVNLLGMSPAQVLDYFDRQSPHPELHRDLIYHVGGRRTLLTGHGEVDLTLAYNPSHLQSVHPVVTGMARAAQARQALGAEKTLAIVLHGDAAFAGQGVVMETLMLAHKPGYSVGGTVHVVINNQVGFTEPNRMDARQRRYCTDVTRMVDAPVLRVNADAPQQLLRAAQIAIEYRMRFACDVVIDLVGYRRLGHSEHDLPVLSSPRLQEVIQHRPTVVEVYGAALSAAGFASATDMARYIERGRALARESFERATAASAAPAVRPQPPAPGGPADPLQGGLPTLARLQAIVAAVTQRPEGMQVHPRTQALVEQWRAVVRDEHAAADWCFAENMAYAAALDAGVSVRVSGLDVKRGTFMHRHAVWHGLSPAGEEREFTPLHRLATQGARFEIVNSTLAEEAVLGFEYGYSIQSPRTLTLWEAQFGDFVNGAQVYIDQYISSGEEKWGCPSGLAMLLPHGYEGVGPEHSNGHLSRFLQLCGGDNMRVACPSTSAQWFHLLREQAVASERKPLVVMTPKGQLYEELGSHSPVGQLVNGRFEPVLGDEQAAHAGVTRVVVCSGKLYYDLHRARVSTGRNDVALLRLEQLYPFPSEAVRRLLAHYPQLRTLVWAQEETRNQGAWAFVRDDLAALCAAGVTLDVVSRAPNGSGATSSAAVHQREQHELALRAVGT